jgi:hypothetical protein
LRGVLYSPKVNFDLKMEYDSSYEGIAQGTTFSRGQHGYDVFTHNLGFNTFHMVAVSRRPGFMAVLDDESVWQQLCDPRFTTPVVREWAGYIREQMVKSERIVRASCYGCACAYMIAGDDDLDEIVQRGLRRRLIEIR